MTLRLSALLVVLAPALTCYADSGVLTTLAAPSAAVPAQRIFIDPVTGDVRAPTPEERQQMRLQAQAADFQTKSADAPRIVEYPNGATGVFIKRPHNLVHAEELPDGSLRNYCNDQAASKEKP